MNKTKRNILTMKKLFNQITILLLLTFTLSGFLFATYPILKFYK